MITTLGIWCIWSYYGCDGAPQATSPKSESSSVEQFGKITPNVTTNPTVIEKDHYHLYELLYRTTYGNVLLSLKVSSGDVDAYISEKAFYPLSSATYNFSCYSPLQVEGIYISQRTLFPDERKTKRDIPLYISIFGYSKSVYSIDLTTTVVELSFYKPPRELGIQQNSKTPILDFLKFLFEIIAAVL